MVDVPISLVSLVDKDRVFFKGNVGMEGVTEADRGVNLYSLAVVKSELTFFKNIFTDPCPLANPLFHREFAIKVLRRSSSQSSGWAKDWRILHSGQGTQSVF